MKDGYGNFPFPPQADYTAEFTDNHLHVQIICLAIARVNKIAQFLSTYLLEKTFSGSRPESRLEQVTSAVGFLLEGGTRTGVFIPLAVKSCHHRRECK
jgi:hypothetical protein